MSRPSNKRRAESPPHDDDDDEKQPARVTSSVAKKPRGYDDDDDPVVEQVYFAGVCQPLTMFEDEGDGSMTTPVSPLLLDMSIVWQNSDKKRGTVKGTVSWVYGMFWAAQQSLDADDQMFWKVAQQQEAIVGEVVVQREKSASPPAASSGSGSGSGSGAAAAAASSSFNETRMFTLRTHRLGPLDTEESTVAQNDDDDDNESAAAAATATMLDAGVIAYSLDLFERERVYHLSMSNSMDWQLRGTVGVLGANHNDYEENEDDDDGLSRGMPLTHVCLHRLPQNLQHRISSGRQLSDPLTLVRAFSTEKTGAALRELERLALDEGLVDRLLKIITRIVLEPTNLDVRNISYDAIHTKLPRLVPALAILGFEQQADAVTHKQRLIWGREQDLMHLCDIYRVLVNGHLDEEEEEE